MRIRAHFCLLAVMAILTGCASHSPSENRNEPESEHPVTTHYNVDQFIHAAEELQLLGRDAALQRLHAMSQTYETHNYSSTSNVFVLCRMLFTRRTGLEFRGPGLGAGLYLGGTEYSDWPLTPIELVDGIPFLMVRGYILAGLAETPAQYVYYCETNCDWSSFRFVAKTDEQKRIALQKLVACPKWKWTLDSYAQQFLSSQIE